MQVSKFLYPSSLTLHYKKKNPKKLMVCLNSCLPASIRARCSVLKSLNLFCWLQMDFSLVPINFFWGFGLWGPWASIQPSYFWPVHPAVQPAKSIFLGVVRVFVQVLEVLNFYSIYFNHLWKLGIALVLHWRDFFIFLCVWVHPQSPCPGEMRVGAAGL